MNSRHVRRSNELIWKFQSTLRTNELLRGKISETPLALLLSCATEARGWRRRSSSRIGVAAPLRSSTFYFLAVTSTSNLFESVERDLSFPLLLYVTSFDRTFTRCFLKYSAGFCGRTFRPAIEVGRPWRWLRAGYGRTVLK